MPAGPSEQLRGVEVRSYAAPTTNAVVFGAHGLAITCISDAPPDQAMLAVRDVIGGGSSPSVLAKVAHFVLGPFGWD